MLRIGNHDSGVGRGLSCFALLLLLVCGKGFAQNPGNVTVTSIANWLRPESADCSSDGCLIASITSLTPVAADRNGIPSINGPGSVTIETGELNFNPAVRTTGNDWFGIKRVTATGPEISANFSGFVVFRTSVVDSPVGQWYQVRALVGAEENSGNNDFGITMANGKLKYAHANGNDNYAMQPQTVYANDRPHILYFMHERGNAAGDSTQIFVDGVLRGTVTALNDQIQCDSIFFGSNLGHTASMALDAYFGDIGLYDDDVTGFSRDRIETYLALKYGITLGHHYKLLTGITNINLYALDPIFNKGIFGVGKCTGTQLDQRISESVDYPGLKLFYGTEVPAAFPAVQAFANTNASYPAIATDNVFQVIGHDAGGVTFSNSFNGVANSRLGRTFKVADSNADTVTLFFPSSTFTGLANITTPGPYYLVYGKDPQFGIGETFVPLIPRPGGGNDHYIHIDFPDNDSTFFTIVRGNNVFAGPGGVAKGLELWLEGGKGIPLSANVNVWNDQSGNDHNTACSCAGISRHSQIVGRKLNYRPYVEAAQVNRIWKTSSLFQGKSVLIVANAKQNGGSQNGLYGFEAGLQAKGLRSNGANLIQRNGGGTDWADAGTNGALLRENGTNITTTTSNILRKWTLLTSRRDSNLVLPNRNFFLGGFVTAEMFDSMNVAEVLVYDQTLAGTGLHAIERLESYLAIKYGLTLTHRYRMSDWDGVATTNVYDPTTYPFDIAGIGRDDAGRLYQRQGKTADVDSLISIALGSHFLYDTLNTNTIGVDKNFIMTGHDGGDISCWSTNEISIAGMRGIYQRLEREWKLQITSGWAGETVEFRLLTDNPNANLPALPPGSTTWVMFADIDNDFRNGNTTAFPMTLSSPGVFTVTVPVSTFPGPINFFTFGTALDSVSLGQTTKCVGGTFKVYGSRLGNVCTELMLTDGSNTYTAVAGGAVSDNTYFIANNLPGGCVDTLLWRIPLIASPADFDLRVDTTTAATGCGAGVIVSNVDNGRMILDSVLVDSSEVANISWPGDSIYCANAPNVLPIIAPGTTVGAFSVFGGPLIGTPNLILPNTTSGQLLLHSGSVGTHTIRYVTTGPFLCKDTADAIIKIRPVGTPTISYANSPYCGGTALSDTVVIVGTKGGRFSSSPGLVFDDTLTGRVNLPASAPGTYTVFYTPHPDSCANVASTTIVVDAPERAYFNYPDTVMCLGGAAELPLIQYRPVTGSFSTAPGSPGPLLSINAPSGSIDLNASQAGTYYIQYSGITGTCIYDAMDTIRIKAPTDATFTLANDTLCLNDPAFIPNRTDPNGYFTSFNNLIGILVDSLTINPPTSTVGGPYNLIYIVPDTFCSDTTALPMFFRGLAAASLTYTDTVVCENSPNPMPVFNTGIAGGIFYSTNGGIIVDSTTGEFNASSTPVGVGYNVFYIVPDPSCPDTVLAATINIDSIPNPYFDLAVDSLCEGSGPYEFDVLRPSGYNLTLFIGANPFNGATSGDTLNVNSLPPGGPYMIRNIQSNAACQDTAYDFITIVEQDSAGIIFTPDIICLNDNNPFPLITGVGGGTFSLGPSPSFVVVDPDSGIMTLDSNTVLGIYSVIYQTVGLCADRDTAYVDIRNNISAQFDYGATEYCQSIGGLVSPDTGFALGGIFKADTTGLVWVDSILGVFDLGASQPGTYLIEYEISNAGACEAKWTDRLVIVEEDTITTLAYAGSPYCPSDPDPSPILTNSVDSLGLYSGTGVYFTNQDLGIISLAATLPGSYTVYFEKLTVCRELFSFPIVIKPAAQAYFNYPSSIYCIGPDNVFPDSISSLGGEFNYRADSSNDFLDIDILTGEIRLETSNEGNYFIDYTIPPSGIICGGTSSFEIRILARPDGIELISNHNNDTFCENTFIQFDAAGADLVTFYLNGDSVGSGTSWEGIGLDSADVVQAYFTTGLGCRDSITRTMHVFDIPEANLLSSPSILSGRDSLDIQVELLTDNTWLDWSVTGIGAVRFTQNSGRSAEGDSSDVVPLGNTVFLDSDFDPAQFTYTIIPRTFLCTGQPLTANIRVNPNEKDVFVPQVITPDGNNQNDTWFIQLKNGIDPANYTIKLFNSAGALVHTMTPLNDTFNGDVADAGYLSDGVYWYLLFNEKGEKVEAGGLTIRRK